MKRRQQRSFSGILVAVKEVAGIEDVPDAQDQEEMDETLSEES